MGGVCLVCGTTASVYSQPDVMDCIDPSGDPLDGVQFTKSEDCEDGTYYKCNSGNRSCLVSFDTPETL